MTINYFIHPHYQENFTQGKIIDATSFKTLHPVAAAWCRIIDANQEKLRALEGVLNLVYYMQENTVLPRNFDQADTIMQLNTQVRSKLNRKSCR
ncbi:hypothetical protein [Chitinophaga barathri]|uniref:Uncharacterized protein n=1 Tax=Chitinophaga barathri TaxID=1647451 RepID=A0A3N4M8V2_9BACT|nr:hypothetical protein [Chitinophaga barathri]RPD40062.1 hypothetical protein EG028_15505 [Chitinophaga barathri]